MAILYGHYSSHNNPCKGVENLISYRPLWETMGRKGYTTYTLRFKYGISHATVQRLQKDMCVSTHTLNKLCEILDCRLDEIAEYVAENK